MYKILEFNIYFAFNWKLVAFILIKLIFIVYKSLACNTSTPLFARSIDGKGLKHAGAHQLQKSDNGHGRFGRSRIRGRQHRSNRDLGFVSMKTHTSTPSNGAQDDIIGAAGASIGGLLHWLSFCTYARSSSNCIRAETVYVHRVHKEVMRNRQPVLLRVNKEEKELERFTKSCFFIGCIAHMAMADCCPT
jgi:hypothetical protein